MTRRAGNNPADDGAPSLSRHHAAGAESARGLLFTILGELVLPAGRPVWTAAFLEVFSRLGVEEKSARQALMRTAGDGWLTAERVGRRTCWHLTNDAVKLLTEGTERIFSFTPTQDDWDGRWIIVLARVPETDRAAKHALRVRLAWAGFGSASAGAWISTHTDRAVDAQKVLTQLNLRAEALIVDGRITSGEPLPDLVSRAWNLDTLADQYQRFTEEFGIGAARDPLARIVELVHAWRRFPWTDPALPAELLPPRWVGTRAAQVFDKRHAAWVAEAQAAWQTLAAQHD